MIHVLTIFTVALAACGPEETPGGISFGAGLRDASDLSGFSDKEASFIDSLFKTYEGAPGWPEMPRRTASISESLSNEVGFKVGLKGNVLGAGAGATTSVTFGLSYNATLLLLRTAVEGDDRFIVDRHGQEVLNVVRDIDFVGLCSFSASVKVGTRFLGEISVFGNGASDQTDLSQAIEVNQGSNFFEIKEGDTVRALQDLCLKSFRERVRDSVVADLKSLVKASVTYAGSRDSDLKAGLLAALFGPKKSGLKIFGEEWNVPRASAQRRADGAFTVSGDIEHPMPWYLAKWPEKIPYALVYRDGKLVQQAIGAPADEPWSGEARELIILIGDEAYMELN
jgi:hypothetical protein